MAIERERHGKQNQHRYSRSYQLIVITQILEGEKMERLSKMEWTENYSDDSGVEYGLRYDGTKDDGGIIEFEHIDKVDFPIDKLNWLIDRLFKMKNELGL